MLVVSREADLITITDKQDLQQAMGEVMEAAERSASQPGHGTRGLPLQTLLTATPLKFQLVRCKEVPHPNDLSGGSMFPAACSVRSSEGQGKRLCCICPCHAWTQHCNEGSLLSERLGKDKVSIQSQHKTPSLVKPVA